MTVRVIDLVREALGQHGSNDGEIYIGTHLAVKELRKGVGDNVAPPEDTARVAAAQRATSRIAPATLTPSAP
jgi:hypothetical protein